MLPVDAAVPLQRDHGGVGTGRGRWCVDRVAAQILASQFFPDIRRVGATYANYVGKPLSYILATPERPDDTENPLRVAYGNEGAPRDLTRFARRFAVEVVDGFGSSEGGVSIARTPDTPEGALGPLVGGVTILDVDTGAECPPGVIGELVNTDGPGQFRGYYRDPEAEADRMRGGVYHSGDLAYRDENGFAYFAGRSATGCGSTARTSAPRPSNAS